ncbi:DUF5617 domain-containing protein [Legionella bozemanae]|uniref:RavJ-like C-terminal domain-containing protein n=1 Tax=Legionella bozemanae TaxID=447 RepID=A0A0W0RQD6_LEGBO|nr:DUF5617 domain-containing protein [Legionella bozemanae]KTC73249.1 hypothetical protein Lboz_1895 [Legionella bozemanae]STO34611.1 Uncharacterised protein [Legionella bozemanae]
MPITRQLIAAQAPKTQGDWFSVSGTVADADDGQGMPTWQFRISILPTRENALKALNALATLEQFQSTQHPEFKVFLPDDNNDLSSWDPTFRGGDRDQRGKEICVYMEQVLGRNKPEYYEGNYPSPDYLKSLMLSMWKGLQDAGVELAYSIPSEGEKEVLCDSGLITPFCYSSFKPYQQRHGILHQVENYNPKEYQDPLEGVSISLEDLQEYNIHPIGAVKSAQRLIYHLNHYQLKKLEAEQELQALLQSAEKEEDISDTQFTDYGEVITALDNVLEMPIEGEEEALTERLREYINLVKAKEVSIALPSQSTLPGKLFSKDLRLLQALADLEDKSEKNIRARLFSAFPQEVQHAIVSAEGGRETFYALCIKHLFQNISQSLENEKKLSVDEMMKLNIDIDRKSCEKAFTYYPQKFQQIYQKLVHCEHEKQMILKEHERFDLLPKPPNNSPYYSEITSKIEGTLAQARAILNDYTRDNSWLSRVAHGNWNRHHLEEVNEIVKAIDNRTISSMEELSTHLAAIPLANPKGSLARRMEFILLPYAQSLQYPESKKDDEVFHPV